jgi:heme a synthase
LFFDTPLWRNFFENALTVQFDHRMLAYLIFVCTLLHAFDVERSVKSGAARLGAFVLFAAVTLQAALGILTLIWHVPLPLALAHQALAMLVLTVASLHAANVVVLARTPLIPAQAEIQADPPLSPGRAG